MRSLYDIRRELAKYKQNLREINKLIAVSDRKTDLFKDKLKIKCKIEKLEEELERKNYDKERNISKN
jgi:hypothetical protein